jgi:hypothetical protein
MERPFYVVFLILILSSIYLYFTFYRNESFQVPAPAAIIKRDVPVTPLVEVSPSGPNPPNARISEIEARKYDTYNVVPLDPYDEKYGSQNIKTNLRYPERSFGPGIVNDNKKLYVANGVASAIINESNNAIQQYSQEMVQNGGLFNESYGANDINLNPNYSAF